MRRVLAAAIVKFWVLCDYSFPVEKEFRLTESVIGVEMLGISMTSMRPREEC
jgi:hypothetical protein